MSKNKNTLLGKPWSTHSTHATYELAVKAKDSLSSSEELQVKIRKYANETFQVKTRAFSTKVNEKPERKTKAGNEKPSTRAQRRSEKMRRKAQQEKKI